MNHESHMIVDSEICWQENQIIFNLIREIAFEKFHQQAIVCIRVPLKSSIKRFMFTFNALPSFSLPSYLESGKKQKRKIRKYRSTTTKHEIIINY